MTLPGEKRRKNVALRLPGRKMALPESEGRNLAESIAWRVWEKASSKKVLPVGDTLESCIASFDGWAAEYYRRTDGSGTGEAYNCEIALRLLRQRYGRMPIDDITYHNIIDARDALIESGLTRETVNQRVAIWKRFFSWALDNRHCSARTKSEVWAVDALKRGRSKAKETDPVLPVSHLHVKQSIVHARKVIRDMVAVQELTGMRPGELCDMKAGEIEKMGAVHLYRPKLHKTIHKGKPRVIVIGPRAWKVLEPYIASEIVFQTPSGTYWNVTNYGKAIRYATRAARKAGVEMPDWNPNQLRHACGTRVRRKFGVAAARAVLGHTEGSGITDRYTVTGLEREIIEAASKVMLRIG